MAQLPPKVPNISPTWPNFGHQQPPNTTTQPSWVDEFLDFSSAKRGSHRRAVSDSVAFVECPILDECRAAPPTQEFDKLDDEQLMSMFTDDFSAVTIPCTVSTSNPSTPSDHNSINDDKSVPVDQQLRNELEVQSPCNSDPQGTPSSLGGDPVVIDPKRVKRILANRQSAQRSRVRKLQYISELERSVTSLQTEVSTLSPRVAFLDHQRLILNVDNSALKQRIAALAQDKIFKDAHQEALKKEVERLRHVYNQQSLKKNATTATLPQPCTDKENFLA